MKILHTADIHLSERKPNTIEALKHLIAKANELNVDYLTISGDFFDSPEEANKLRPKLRNLLSNLNFKVILIPGNHDQNCYTENLDFGSSIRITVKRPLEVFDIDNTTSIVAFPFAQKATLELQTELKRARQENKINILLIHCTLDIDYSDSDMGMEGDRDYFSISSDLLADLGYDYILAGHFHKDCLIKQLKNNSMFIYPGSPTSITVKEMGKRNAVLLDLDTKEVNSIPLNTFYYDELSVMVYPNKENKAIEEIKDWVTNHEHENCKMKIKINGFGEISENDFRCSLENHISDRVELENEYRDISTVLNHPLFIRFKDILYSSEYENKNDIENFVIEVFSNLLVRGDIS